MELPRLCVLVFLLLFTSPMLLEGIMASSVMFGKSYRPASTFETMRGLRSCGLGDEECLLESESLVNLEVDRRILASVSSYIAYRALQPDNTPCPPQSGHSYYTPSCGTVSGPANPYKRACSRLTYCARDVR
eukprot:c20358_g1_i1 orf=269-664(+)